MDQRHCTVSQSPHTSILRRIIPQGGSLMEAQHCLVSFACSWELLQESMSSLTVAERWTCCMSWRYLCTLMRHRRSWASTRPETSQSK